MFLKSTHHLVPGIVFLSGLLLVASCEADKSYDLDSKPIDLSMTLVEEGVSVSLGDSEKISLGQLINSAGESINDVIKTNENGEYFLKYDGAVSLNDRLAELDLANLAVIDGISLGKQEFEYKIGDFDPDKFKVPAGEYKIKRELDGIDIVNVKTQSISASAEGLGYKAGLDQYKDVVTGNEALDLSTSIGEIPYNEVLLEKATVSEFVAAWPMETVPVPKEYLPDIKLQEKEVAIAMEPVVLDENITKISNVKVNSNAKLVIDIKLNNVCFTQGSIVPAVKLDFSKVLKLKNVEGNIIDLSSITLTNAGEWKGSGEYVVEGLVQDEFEGSISLGEKVKVSGEVKVNDAVTTKTKFAQTQGDMSLSIVAHFTDFTIESADLAIKADPVTPSETVSLGDYEDFELPPSIDDVKTIILDETKPFKFKITPSNLDIFKQINLPYTFTFNFPSNIIVKDAVDGKLTFSGDFANGAVEKEIVIQELRPTVKNKMLSLKANVEISANVTPQNIVINSANIPTSADKDLSLEVSFEGTPVIKDYQIQLGDNDEEVKLNDTLELDADGLGDFSNIRITAEGSPVLTIGFQIPSVKEHTLKPGSNGLTISLPDVMVFDASGIDSKYNFNEATNSITLRDAFPKQVSLPIKGLLVKPIKENGKTIIRSAYSADGSISIPPAEVSQSDLEDTFGQEVSLSISVPEIKAKSISLDEQLKFDIDERFKLTVKNLPEQLKRIDEIVLDEVYATMEAAFDGLPTSGESPVNVDLTVTLPDFVAPNVIPIKGGIVNGKLTAQPVKIEKLYGLDLTANPEIEGNIVIAGSITLDGATINLAELKSEVKVTIDASIQNQNGKLAVKKASGMFEYNIEEETSLSLDDIPAELKGDNLCLDLANPVMNIELSSNLGIPMTASLELIPYVAGQPVEANKIVLENVALPYSTDPDKTDVKKYSICKAASSAAAGHEFLAADITGILRELPDDIKVKLSANIDPARTSILIPSATYTMDINYGIEVPLAFGDKFFFSTDTEFDLSGAQSITSYGNFAITANVLNQTPLNVAVSLSIVDAEGTVIPQVISGQTVNAQELSILPAAEKALSHIEFYLSPKSGSKAISKAKINLMVKALPNVVFKESDCLQISNVVVKLPDGITINPNE